MTEPIRLLASPNPAPEPERVVTPRSAIQHPGRDDSHAALEGIRNVPVTVRFGNRAAEFSYDPELDRVVVRIYSSATEPREIVRQIPPEDYVAFAARYRELLGVLFNEEV